MNTKQMVAAAVVGVSLVGLGFWFGSVSAATSEPGSQADPLVSKSYVDNRLQTALQGTADKAYVDNAVKNAGAALQPTIDAAVKAAVEAALTDLPTDSGAGFQVVNVPKGSAIIGEASTEIVLRGGKATAIVAPLGGLLDATGGTDVWQGQAIAPNHLLVVPRSDGRGLQATTDLILMVKGSYRIQ